MKLCLMHGDGVWVSGENLNRRLPQKVLDVSITTRDYLHIMNHNSTTQSLFRVCVSKEIVVKLTTIGLMRNRA